MKIQLQGYHFSSANTHGGSANTGHGGQMLNSLHNGNSLTLRCTAKINELYFSSKEVELGVPQKDPIPARVTSSGSGVTNFFSSYFSSHATLPYPEKILYILTISTLCTAMTLASLAQLIFELWAVFSQTVSQKLLKRSHSMGAAHVRQQPYIHTTR